MTASLASLLLLLHDAAQLTTDDVLGEDNGRNILCCDVPSHHTESTDRTGLQIRKSIEYDLLHVLLYTHNITWCQTPSSFLSLEVDCVLPLSQQKQQQHE